jgi:hypothetical protein
VASPVNLGTGEHQRFFCSELILAAYAAAGITLSPTALDPNGVVELTWFDQYQGHLKFA